MSDPAPFDPYALTDLTIQAPPKSLWAALRKIGPGIILAGSIIGSGELLLTTSLGADYGFVFLWLIFFSCVIKVFVQLELGRYAISSGKPTLAAFNELPGVKLGAHWMVWWWFIMLMFTVAQLGAMAGGVGQALHLAFPSVSTNIAQTLESSLPGLSNAVRAKPEYPWAALAAIGSVLLLLSGGYRRIERITTVLVAGVTLVTVICVGMLPGAGFPLRTQDLEQAFSFDAMFIPAAIAAAFGAFGITGVGATELYAYPYWCLEKGYARFTGPRTESPEWADRARGWLRVMYLDAWVSMVVFTTATVAFYILGATVLHRQDLHPAKDQMIATLSEMYVPSFGAWTKIFFLIGVWAVLFKTLYVASAANSRLSADFLGIAGFVKYTNHEQRERWTRRFCVFYPLFGLGLYIWLRDPKLMVTIGGFVQAMTLPLISAAAIYLRYRRTDPRLLPGKLSDFWLWFAFVSITVVAVFALTQWGITTFSPPAKAG
jgi:Mn2+/Fe2+ NRAMP family transporter